MKPDNFFQQQKKLTPSAQIEKKAAGLHAQVNKKFLAEKTHLFRKGS